MQFGLLGPVEAWTDHGGVAVGGVRALCILAALLLEAGRVVSIDRLIEAAWGADAPVGARVQVQNRVSGLRRILRSVGDDMTSVSTRGSGYVILLGDGQLDLHRFGSDVSAAEASIEHGDKEEARRLLDRATA